MKDLDYTPLNSLPAANVTVEVTGKELIDGKGRLAVMLKNHSGTVAFGNRLRLVNKATGERVLPVIMSDNYLMLMPGEEKIVTLEAAAELLTGGVELLLKQYGQAEKSRVTLKW